jgi:hypothetical protein
VFQLLCYAARQSAEGRTVLAIDSVIDLIAVWDGV